MSFTKLCFQYFCNYLNLSGLRAIWKLEVLFTLYSLQNHRQHEFRQSLIAIIIFFKAKLLTMMVSPQATILDFDVQEIMIIVVFFSQNHCLSLYQLFGEWIVFCVHEENRVEQIQIVSQSVARDNYGLYQNRLKVNYDFILSYMFSGNCCIFNQL